MDTMTTGSTDGDPLKQEGEDASQAKTTEYSFILRPSEYGIGVFATHAIAQGTFLRLFGDRDAPDPVTKECRVQDVPDAFRMYCLHRPDGVIRPADFGCMEIGWFLNHSKHPNARHAGYDYYAARDIQEGEEITIDYNTLDEPEEHKEAYYR